MAWEMTLMPESQDSSKAGQAPADTPPERRPAPPAYKPAKELIGYIEKGQKSSTEKRDAS